MSELVRCPNCKTHLLTSQLEPAKLMNGHSGPWLGIPNTPAPAGEKNYKELYFDLLMQVAKKYPGESRHETARRYIREREEPQDNTPEQAVGERKAQP